MTIDYNNVLKKIIYLRKSRGWIARDIAQKIGIKPSTLCQMETGRSRLSLRVLIGLGEVFNLSVDELKRYVPEDEFKTVYPPNDDGIKAAIERLINKKGKPTF